MTRWATFDCYGTLIDWNSGIRAELARIFDIELPPEPVVTDDGVSDGAAGAVDEVDSGDDEAAGDEAEIAARAEAAAKLDALVERYHLLEREVQGDGYRPYRDVMTETARRLGVPAQEEGALVEALPGWKPFAEASSALGEIKERGWKIAILSNADSEQIAASVALLDVDFDEIVAAQEVRSYKPALAHWTEFYVRTLADKGRHVHVAASLYHDIAPAVRLRLPTIWINRLGEHPGPSPTVQLPDLQGAPSALDGIYP